MNHNNKIVGAFTFPNLYMGMINRFDNAEFVEVGADRGSSTHFMGVEIINSNKNIKFNVVDSWGDNPGSWASSDIIYQEFVNNIAPVKEVLKDRLNIIRSFSVDAANLFKDDSLDFVFIDAAHDYDNVLADITAWFPKVKKTGVIAGHDYYAGHYGVEKAVNEFFYRKLDIHSQEFCWVVQKYE